MTRHLVATCILLSAIFLPSIANARNIDDFTVGLFTLAVDGDDPAQSSEETGLSPAHVIGGTRKAILSVVPGGSVAQCNRVSPQTSVYFSLIGDSSARCTLTYDNLGAGFDMVGNSDEFFAFDVIELSGHGTCCTMSFDMLVRDANGKRATVRGNITSGSGTTVLVPYKNFLPRIKFTNIDYIQIRFYAENESGNFLQMRVSNFRTFSPASAKTTVLWEEHKRASQSHLSLVSDAKKGVTWLKAAKHISQSVVRKVWVIQIADAILTAGMQSTSYALARRADPAPIYSISGDPALSDGPYDTLIVDLANSIAGPPNPIEDPDRGNFVFTSIDDIADDPLGTAYVDAIRAVMRAYVHLNQTAAIYWEEGQTPEFDAAIETLYDDFSDADSSLSTLSSVLEITVVPVEYVPGEPVMEPLDPYVFEPMLRTNLESFLDDPTISAEEVSMQTQLLAGSNIEVNPDWDIEADMISWVQSDWVSVVADEFGCFSDPPDSHEYHVDLLACGGTSFLSSVDPYFFVLNDPLPLPAVPLLSNPGLYVLAASLLGVSFWITRRRQRRP